MIQNTNTASDLLSDNAQSLSSDALSSLKTHFDNDSHNRLMQNAITVTDIKQIATNRNIVVNMDNSFSNKLDDWSVTSQKQSGRCWLFAGTNMLRAGTMAKMNIKDFEFSQNYLFFWDKLERANYFLESIIDTAANPNGDRTVDHLLMDPIGDGGQWNMFVSLIKKYGLIPKAAMPETQSSSCSPAMNNALSMTLRKGAMQIRTLHAENNNIESLRKTKQEILTIIYRILSIHLGTPPTHFDWQYRDKDDAFFRDDKITPLAFVKKYVTLDVDEYVCLVNDPRETSPYNKTYTVGYLGNVVGGDDIRYLNVDIQVIKDLTRETILGNDPVWFGCDVGPQMSRDLGLWDKTLFDYDSIYNSKMNFEKGKRLLYKQSAMTHAMLFTGVDIFKDQTRRWRVENSWGKENGLKGFYIMNDSWFDEYVFEVAVKKSLLSDELQQVLTQPPIVLPPWDPMGSLAC
jgi:bleomycin hydrolase